MPKPGADPRPEEIIAYCRERLAPYKYPREVRVIAELPKGPTGKILKRELRRDDPGTGGPGPVNTAIWGSYMHEHIFVLTADVQQNYPAEWGSEEDRIADAVGKLRAVAAQGVRTLTPPWSGSAATCLASSASPSR